jgi:adenylate cyclase
MSTTRRLAAILAADVAGYSRLMAADEVGTLAALKAARREVVDPAIDEHKGRIVKTTGDGMLVEFASAVDAVTCAMAVQEKMAARGGNLAFRIGINVGDIIIDGDDIFGDGVNVAARVEGECPPGGTTLSAQAFDQVRNKTMFAFDDLGERTLKNIDRPIRIYAAKTLGVVAASASIAVAEPGKSLPLPDKPSIAVLPFQNMSGDPEQEYFADGLTENLTTDLSRFHGLFVIGRNTAFAFKGKSIDIKTIGRELGIRYVLEGSVQRGANRIRVNVQLVETETGMHRWADRFDRDRTDLFAVQDEIARRVAYALSIQLSKAERQRFERERSSNPDSIDLLLRASADTLATTHPDRIAARLTLYEKAMQLDPRNGDAWAGIARSRAQLVFSGWSASPADDLRLAMEASERALAISPNISGALLARGHVFLAQTNYAAALEAYEHARELNPSIPMYHQLVGLAKIGLGRAAEALEPLNEAVRLSPHDSYIADFYLCLGWAYWELERYSEALDWLERSYAQNPRLEYPYFFRASTQLRLGRQDAAMAAIQEVLKLYPGWTTARVKALILPTRSAAEVAPFFDDLRKAGLPE